MRATAINSGARTARLAIAGGVSLLALALIVAVAHAGKVGDSVIGQPTSVTGTAADGGLFNTPRDVAVNESTGQIFVADDNLRRIQRFGADGTFEVAWGRDVVEPGGTGDTPAADDMEVCTVAPECQGSTTNGTGLGGTFANAQGIAVHQATGELYVRDRGNLRVQHFGFTDGGTPADPSDDVPVFERAWGWNVIAASATTDPDLGDAFEVCETAADCQAGATGANPGQFAASSAASNGIDIHQPTGDVIVADPGNRRVQQFTQSGLAADTPPSAAAGEVFGSPTHFVANRPLYLAVDNAGVVYAASYDNFSVNYRVQRYDTTADTFMPPITDPTLIGDNGADQTVGGMEVDRSTGHLLLVNNPVPGPQSTVGPDTLVREIDPSSMTLVDVHMEGSGDQTTNGLGINTSTGRLYVSASSGAIGHRVLVLDDDGAQPPPDLTIDPVSDPGVHSATFTGTVNPRGPRGLPTTYRFEVSKDGSTWTPVTAEENVGDGTAPVPVTTTATGLEANSTYYVRIVARKAFNNPQVESAVEQFFTDAAPPEVTTGAVQHRSATGAEILGRVNPNNLPTTYHFEYGETTSYGRVAPATPADAGSAGTPRPVSQRLSGLDPETTYHYRIVATNEEGTTVGDDETFTTRVAAPIVEPPRGRSYEIVTPPNKVNRRGGSQTGMPTVGVPSPDGDKLLYMVRAAIGDPDAGSGIAMEEPAEVVTRTGGGWDSEAVFDIPPVSGGGSPQTSLSGSSLDFRAQAWYVPTPLFASGSYHATRILDGPGADLGPTGWYPWILDPALATGVDATRRDEALFTDAGTQMVRWGNYRGLLGPADPSNAMVAGRTIYRGGPGGDPRWAPEELVNECTGSGAGATSIPSREPGDSPLPADDVVTGQPCEAGSPTSLRGGVVGNGRDTGSSAAARAMSEDGRRIFFMSPDPQATGVQSSRCAGTILAPRYGPDTDCAPQLYVRQYGSDGTATVRWISRPAGGSAPEAAFGPTIFQGASDDGRIVYFMTTAPLTPDDPNAGSPLASESSWDLYRYELPADLDADPSGGVLTRVSRGPTGDADPNVRPSDTRDGTTARYISDDGQRVYFVTNRAIPDVDGRPAGGVTDPGGAQSNPSTRNLYLFDANETGGERWRFIAQLPTSNGANTPAACATRNAGSGYPFAANVDDPGFRFYGTGCVRGTVDGDAIVFQTPGQLTEDDSDTAVDVYLYDLGRNELTRLSAPPAGVEPYPCVTVGVAEPVRCNGAVGSKPEAATGDLFGLSGGRQDNLVERPGGLIVYFESALPLVPEDEDEAMDVYEWRAGELTVISPRDGRDAFFSGASRDGRNVFFATKQRIDPREIDEADWDIYDARVDGGFPPPPGPPVACDVHGDACQDRGRAPSVVAPPTSAPGGGANASPGARARLRLARPGRKARRRAARTGVIRLRVRTRKQGRVAIVARARVRVGRGRPTVMRVGRKVVRVRKAGSRVVVIRLSRRARRHLRSGRALRLTVQARQTGAQRRVVRFSLRRAGR